MVVVPEGTGGWFDLWHTHPNDENLAERWANLLTTWSRVEEAGRATGRPWQSWLVIEFDAPRDDVVYLHTPNPNRDNFPYMFEGVEWGAEPPGWVAVGVALQFGRSSYGEVELLWVRKQQDAKSSDAKDGEGR